MAAGLPEAAPAPPPGVAAPRRSASARQLFILCVYAVVIWSVGNGLLPLLPKFATTLGAGDVTIGIYLGTAYAAIALGSASAGWLADHLGRIRVQMVLLSLVVAPLFALTAWVTLLWQLVVLTGVLWWFGGVSLTLASIVAGLSAGPDQRGTVLGILAFTAPLGSVIGGLGIGLLADALGFSGLWIVIGLAWLVCPVAGLFVEDVAAGPKPRTARSSAVDRLWVPAFALLLGCGVLGAFGTFLGGFGRSLVMRSFSNAAITSTVAVSGLATLPFPVLLGYLSDRFGRVRFLGLCYLLGVAGLVVYSVSGVLWQFWAGSALVAFVSYVSTGVGSALVVDLVDRGAVSRGLALFSSTGWVGGILGFAAGGLLFNAVGYASGFLVGAGLLGASLILLVPIARAAPSRRAPAP